MIIRPLNIRLFSIFAAFLVSIGYQTPESAAQSIQITVHTSTFRHPNLLNIIRRTVDVSDSFVRIVYLDHECRPGRLVENLRQSVKRASRVRLHIQIVGACGPTAYGLSAAIRGVVSRYDNVLTIYTGIVPFESMPARSYALNGNRRLITSMTRKSVFPNQSRRSINWAYQFAIINRSTWPDTLISSHFTFSPNYIASPPSNLQRKVMVFLNRTDQVDRLRDIVTVSSSPSNARTYLNLMALKPSRARNIAIASRCIGCKAIVADRFLAKFFARSRVEAVQNVRRRIFEQLGASRREVTNNDLNLGVAYFISLRTAFLLRGVSNANLFSRATEVLRTERFVTYLGVFKFTNQRFAWLNPLNLYEVQRGPNVRLTQINVCNPNDTDDCSEEACCDECDDWE